MSRVSAARARDHVSALLAGGMGTRSIAERAQVARFTVKRVLHHPTITSATEAAILSVPLRLAAPKNVVPAAGTHRRIQGLMAIGWPTPDQARLVGRTDGPYRSSLGKDIVLRSTAEDVRLVYDKLSMQLPTGRRSEWVKGHARKRRYFPPLAWDDERIDDPDALPCLLPPVVPVGRDLELAVQHVVAGHDVPVTADIRREVVRRMADRPPREVAKVARCTGGNVEKIRKVLEAAS